MSNQDSAGVDTRMDVDEPLQSTSAALSVENDPTTQHLLSPRTFGEIDLFKGFNLAESLNNPTWDIDGQFEDQPLGFSAAQQQSSLRMSPPMPEQALNPFELIPQAAPAQSSAFPFPGSAQLFATMQTPPPPPAQSAVADDAKADKDLGGLFEGTNASTGKECS